MNSTVPVWIDDAANAAILAVSEDRLAGFQLDPFGAIAEQFPVVSALCAFVNAAGLKYTFAFVRGFSSGMLLKPDAKIAFAIAGSPAAEGPGVSMDAKPPYSCAGMLSGNRSGLAHRAAGRCRVRSAA